MRDPKRSLDIRKIDPELKQRMRAALENTQGATGTTWASPFRAAGGKHAIS